MATCAYDYDGGQTRYSQIKAKTIELEAEVARLKSLLEQSEGRRSSSCCCHHPHTLNSSETSLSSHSTDSSTQLPSLAKMFPDLAPPPNNEVRRTLLPYSSSSDSALYSSRGSISNSPADASDNGPLDPLLSTATLPLSTTLPSHSLPRKSTSPRQAAHAHSRRYEHRPLAPYPPRIRRLSCERGHSSTPEIEQDAQPVYPKVDGHEFVREAQWQTLRGDEDQRGFGGGLPKANLTRCLENCEHGQCQSPLWRSRYT